MIEITRLEKIGGPLTKRISLGEDGRLISDGSACTMSTGRAERVQMMALGEVANLIASLGPHEAIALGRLKDGLPQRVSVTTQNRLASLNGKATPEMIARTGDFISYAAGHSALALIDLDTKGMPDDVKARIKDAGGFWKALCQVLPPLATSGRIIRRSTSTGISRTDTGEALPGSNGLHIYLNVQDGEDIERFLRTLHERCWLAGFGWHMVGAGGQLLDRSLVDRMVYAAERLVFEGAPVLVEPLVQDLEARQAVVHEGVALDTKDGCPPLRIVEAAELRTLKAKSAHTLAPARAVGREAFATAHAETLAARAKITRQQARQIIERQCDGILLPDLVLPWDDDGFAGCTVADVLADPARFAGATLADPLEGAAYGRAKAKIMRRTDGTPWINSFAHGQTVYELRFDARAAAAAVAGAGGDDVADTFVKVAANGDLDADAKEALRNTVAEMTGIGKRALDAKLKSAQKAKADGARQEAKDRRTAERRDTRPQVPLPAPDAPWLPMMGVLNDVLSSSKAAEPPMRDLDGVVTQVRVRRVPDLHSLSAVGANEGEGKDTRLPAPEQPLLTRLDETQLAELIERHIDFVDDEGRSVHLGTAFVRHFRARSDNVLPTITGVTTLPLVTIDGLLLCKPGLDRERGLVFRVPPEFLRLVPDAEEITPEKVAAAMKFLTDDWLCDVLTDYTGKATLVAAALTIIERAMLPERPAFFVTAGRRGGGKTTALQMLLMAVTGSRPSAAAWSPNEEERRKSLFSYLLEGLPALIFDNIPRGSQLSCPHIEKAVTSTLYSDRRLGVSETVTANSSMVILFTGNNISPKGDLASRSLKVHLEVDRADPENRPFRHPDPLAWTEANRGLILRALYTVLLGNPNRNADPQTRFKTWWRLIGSAVENAAKLHATSTAERIAAMVEDPTTNPPVAISFGKLFLSQEVDDEEGSALVDALSALATKWPNKMAFSASELVKYLDDTSVYRLEEEKQGSLTVREFLFPASTGSQAVTPRAAGKRLKRHSGEPVIFGDKTLILRNFIDTHDKMARFQVEVR